MVAVNLLLLGLIGMAYGVPTGESSGYDPNDDSWTYEGPEYWPIIFPNCNGVQQSPIDIDAARMQDIYLYDNLQYNRYNVKMNGLVSNDGHTLKWTIDEINKPTLKGGFLSVPYNLYEMYFHWGADNCRGSEHTIDGKRSPGELQIVMYKNTVSDLEQGAKETDGIVIMSILLEVGDEDNQDLDPIFKAADGLQTDDAGVSVEIEFDNFINYETIGRGYYYYHGSFTTPAMDCAESVQWFIMEREMLISEAQFQILRHLKDADGVYIHDNFRHLQPLRNRIIKRVFN